MGKVGKDEGKMLNPHELASAEPVPVAASVTAYGRNNVLLDGMDAEAFDLDVESTGPPCEWRDM